MNSPACQGFRLKTGLPPDPPAPRLIADAMLGALVRWLRALDVDVVYDPALDDAALVDRAAAEGRTILTRDRRLTERRLARDHLLIRSDDVDEQVRQVVAELGLEPDPGRLLGRCLRCNEPLEPIDAEAARAHVPPWVARTHEEFRACPVCSRVYWRGTHVKRMAERLQKMGV
jgi:uncharacterized protein